MSLTPVNNASPQPLDSNDATPGTGHGPAPQNTATASLYVQTITQTQPGPSRYDAQLRQGAPTPLNAQKTAVAAHPSPALLKQIGEVAQQAENYIEDNLHLFCPGAAPRIIWRLNAATDLDPVRIETPSLSELETRLRAEARNMDPSFKPDRTWALNALATFLQTRILADNRSLFEIAVAVDAVPHRTDEEKAVFLHAAQRNASFMVGVTAQQIVERTVSGQ
ncbi:hypothetical protein [Methylocystis echinoides]|uniref:Uncharacterized protein n=1 Tax=Methylocystis echinoides TaxID=29468 RepID=A0A9W6LS50_9HYPH|nr:hypothetical protein [Methylocystis echinoides]GLI93305.1 hypothetical protein LMG27198_22970 [Methylocystis echinoides]